MDRVRKRTLAPEVIGSQFNGPPTTGNGGYVAGLLAHRLTDQLHCVTAVTSKLLRPPPLDAPLHWRDQARGVSLVDDEGEVVGTAEPGSFREGPPEAPTLDEARAAGEAYDGFNQHPFPTCFTCGIERAEGDGLRVFSGPLADGRVACSWTAHESFADGSGRLRHEFAWAAMDCPGGWAAGIAEDKPMLLGKMTAVVDYLPPVGEECIVVGSLQRVDGRKHFTSTALYAPSGSLVGHAEQIWITI